MLTALRREDTLPSPARVVVLGSFVHAHWWSVARLPGPGESCLAQSVHSELGGKGLNVGVGIQRLGVAVDLVMGVGRDVAAQALAELLQREGIGQQHVYPVSPDSGRGAGLVDAHGENSIAVFPGANMAITAADMDRAASSIATAALVYGQLEMAPAAVLGAFDMARSHGVPTVLNASPAQGLHADLRDKADVLLVNGVEAAQLLGLSGRPALLGTLESYADGLDAAVRSFMAGWPGHALVVTVGPLGAVVFVRDQPPLLQTATTARPGGDSAGAGDGFAAGLCAALARGWDWPQAMELACVCGAAVASGKGVLDHLPRQSELRN